jgi:cyclopropane fatty-acyl-phospholipid synthase-like methyltransferase
METSSLIRKPRVDDKQVQELALGMWVYPTVLAAYQLGLFRALERKSHTPSEVAQALGIEARPAEALLAASASLGLLSAKNGRYALSNIGEDYLSERSPTFFGPFLDLMIASQPLCCADVIKKAVTTNSPQAPATSEMYRSPEQAAAFYKAMHAHSIAEAIEWPKQVDLSQHQTLLDIGGGSGVHSIGAAINWPKLSAIVFDLPNACDAADSNIAKYRLSERVRTQRGSMWEDPYPQADVHLYSLVFPDWPRDKCLDLARKSFAALKSKDRIILHEMLFDDDRSGPVPTAGFNVMMLIFTHGRFHSGPELAQILSDAGFTQVEVKRTSGYWGIVSGVKP